MKKSVICALCLVSGVQVSVQAADTELPREKKAGEKLRYYHDSTPLNAHHSIYSDIYIHRWLDAPHDGMEPIPQAEQDRISDVFLEDCRAKEKYFDLLGGLVYRRKWDEAIAIAPKAAAYYEARRPIGWDLVGRALSYLEWANALYGAGRTEEAKAKIEELVAKNIPWAGFYNGARTRYPNPSATASGYRHWFDPNRMDAIGLPKWSEGVAYPEPQVAKYEQGRVKCPKITIVLKNVDENDARIRLLTLKLKRRGFGCEIARKIGDYTLAIALDENCKVDRPEGYTLVSKGSRTVIKGRDRQGVLWGIVSFLQILDKDRKQMRECSLEDWPACPKRGYIGSSWGGNCEFAVFNKLNYITIKGGPLSLGAYTPLNRMAATEEAKDFNGLGLDLFYDIRGLTMDCAWPLCWNVNLARMIEDGKIFAKCGAGIYFPYDDARYWESATYTEEDRATGLKPSDYDAKFITRMYNAIKAEYPNFRMQFCPPFYWGPNAGHPYPDDREKYLKSIAEIMPKEIDIYWSGERVGSIYKEKKAVDWFSGLIGRRPILYQNKTGPHHYHSYIADATHWEKWYYDGFVDRDMGAIQKNATTPTECPQITTLADYCWNPKAYDADRSIKRGLDNYAGRGLYELLKPARDKLSYFDFYKYGSSNPRIIWEDKVQLRKDLDYIKEVTARAQTLVGTNFFNSMGSWNAGISWAENAYRAIERAPSLEALHKQEKRYLDNIRLYAQTNNAYNAKTDILLDTLDFKPFVFGYFPSTNQGAPYPHSLIIGHCDAWTTGTAKFRIDQLKRGAEYKVVLAVFTSWSNVKIEVNGTLVSEVPIRAKTVRVESRWITVERVIPAGVLKKGENEITISNDNCPFKFIHCLIRRDEAKSASKK